jgi:signal transduction histidine kinase
VIWRRWRDLRSGDAVAEPLDPFTDLLEPAPLMALLLDASSHVVAANAAAREFFAIDPARLPASLVEATREARLEGLLRLGQQEGEVRLSHRPRVLVSRVAPGPRPGDSLLFLTDVTELRRLQTVRQEFVANLAHELRTPLTSLRLAAESLADAPAPARLRFADRVIREADLLAAIIDNLRELTQIESGGVVLELGPVNVAELLRESADRAAGRRTEVQAEPDLKVVADRSKLTQALANLVDNAHKFSPAAAPIELTAETEGPEVVVRVRDHGPGISPEHWDRVFERFYKVDPARPREAGGSGLGLAITKHLVLAMGGRVWTEAARDGGQVFAIALPRFTSP